jgi:hypothetical protein
VGEVGELSEIFQWRGEVGGEHRQDRQNTPMLFSVHACTQLPYAVPSPAALAEPPVVAVHAAGTPPHSTTVSPQAVSFPAGTQLCTEPRCAVL